MIESTSQGLQTAGGAEREARELRKLILAVAREAVELAIIRSDLTWDDAADITGKQIAIDAALAILGQATCDDQPTESAQKLLAFAARCANEARLEALEQLGPLIKEWRGKRFDHQLYCMCGSCQSERDCADALEDRIRALKAAPAPSHQPQDGRHGS